jgi:hypothetical protein
MMHRLKMTEQQFAHLGGGVLGYVKEIAANDAHSMLGENIRIPAEAKLFCLYSADGTPISISGSREAAISHAAEHDLTPASVH